MTYLELSQRELADALKMRRHIFIGIVLMILMELFETVMYWVVFVYLHMEFAGFGFLSILTGFYLLLTIDYFFETIAHVEQLRDYIRVLSPES